LSEQFQMPVLLMGDTTLGVRTESIPTPDLAQYQIVNRLGVTGHDGNATNGSTGTNGVGLGIESGYRRYQITETGISPMAIPGQDGGQYVATGLEHNESGRPRSDASNHRQMTDKRFSKLEAARKAAPAAHYYGDQDSDVGILCWGSSWGTVVEAIDAAAAKGLKVAAMAPRMVWPLPDDQILPFIESKRVVLVPEMNYSGQFAQLLRARYLREVVSVTDYSGGVFTVARLVQEIEGVHQHAR